MKYIVDFIAFRQLFTQYALLYIYATVIKYLYEYHQCLIFTLNKYSKIIAQVVHNNLFAVVKMSGS